MKSAFISVAFAAFAAAAPHSSSPQTTLDINGLPIVVKQPGINGRAVCNADNALRALRNPKVSASASLYCSALLQQTVVETASSATVILTSTRRTTSTTKVSTSVTTTASSGVATETVKAVCGTTGYGNLVYDIFQDDSGIFANRLGCAALCKEKGGASFGFGVSTCACYDAPLAQFFRPNSTSVYSFYDQICPDINAGPLVKRAGPVCVPKPLATPTYIQATYPASRVSSACACLISAVGPACTVTQTGTGFTSTVTATNTIGETLTITSTATVTEPTSTTTTFALPPFTNL